MKLPTVTTITSVEMTHEILLDDETLLRLLRNAGYSIPDHGATVVIGVPGGADWSNTDLDVDGDTPIRISWTTTSTDVTED